MLIDCFVDHSAGKKKVVQVIEISSDSDEYDTPEPRKGSLKPRYDGTIQRNSYTHHGICSVHDIGR